MIRWLVVATCLVLGATDARAEKLVLRDVHGEADVADEAVAVGFLVHSALAKDPRTLVGPVPADLTVATAIPLLITLRADHAVLLELGRDGTGLRLTIAIVDPDGLLIVGHVVSGDGDVAQLAQRGVDKIAAITHATTATVPGLSLGWLRPFALAMRTGDPAALADTIPTIALAAPAIAPALSALPMTTIAARALGTLSLLDARPGTDLAAHAFSAIARSEVTAADALLGKPAKGEPGLVLLSRATLAEIRNDLPNLHKLLAQGLATDEPRALLAFMSSLPLARLTPALVRGALALVQDVAPTAGVVSRLGLLGAEAGLEGSLELIAVRDLDEAELARLLPLIDGAATPTILRLRAEVSMRRAEGQATAIDTFLAAAPNDVRAHLDHGLVLMAAGRRTEAAAELDAAGNQRLRGRVMFLAADLAEAAKSFDKPSSAEELALAALLAKQLDDAVALADKADKLAPANPLVQRVVALVAEHHGEGARAKLARQIADEGNAPAFTLAAAAPPPPPPTPNKPATPPPPTMGPATHADQGGAFPVVPIAIAGGAVVIVGGVLLMRRGRRRGAQPKPTPEVDDAPPALQELVIESPPMQEPEAEPFADFPFALDPEPPPVREPEAEPFADFPFPLDPEPAPLSAGPAPEGDLDLGLELAPPAEELVFDDQLPDDPLAVSFHPMVTPLPPSGALDLGIDDNIPSMPGLVLDRYRTTRELGRGAMGVVYRAWDTNLEREVAIKVMAEELRANTEAMQLFTQEAKSLAQLNHANIVTIYDQVTVGDKVYMIMELVDGTTLEDTLLRRKFTWREAVALADQLCAGLAYAHARKIIHRDIKPANIFMTTDGGIKLGDFGLARVMRELNFRATEVRGTPLYMAPEQITGSEIDHRTDLYAVGCTLYELVTGRPPFIDGDIMYQQVHTNPIPVSMLVPAVPKLLERLIMNLLAKQLEGRPKTANEVRSVIKSVS